MEKSPGSPIPEEFVHPCVRFLNLKVAMDSSRMRSSWLEWVGLVPDSSLKTCEGFTNRQILFKLNGCCSGKGYNKLIHFPIFRSDLESLRFFPKRPYSCFSVSFPHLLVFFVSLNLLPTKPESREKVPKK